MDNYSGITIMGNDIFLFLQNAIILFTFKENLYLEVTMKILVVKTKVIKSHSLILSMLKQVHEFAE